MTCGVSSQRMVCQSRAFGGPRNLHPIGERVPVADQPNYTYKAENPFCFVVLPPLRKSLTALLTSKTRPRKRKTHGPIDGRRRGIICFLVRLHTDPLGGGFRERDVHRPDLLLDSYTSGLPKAGIITEAHSKAQFEDRETA